MPERDADIQERGRTQQVPVGGQGERKPEPSRRGQLNDRRAEIIRVFAELGFVELLVKSGLWRYAPTRLKASASVDESGLPDQPARFRQALEQLGGAFVKLGQVLSARPDLVPGEYVAELQKLQDDIASEPFDTMRALIESELECPLDEAFASFCEEPLGSASISQVHSAKLLDGTEVVVKVQRPNAAVLIDLDLELMTRAARALDDSGWAEGADVVGLVSEFGTALRSELDFTSEGHHLDLFGEFFERDETVVIPHVHWDQTTSRVLTESRIDGIPLSRPDEIRTSGGDIPVLVRHGVDAYMRMVFELRSFHSDPHPGNLLALPGDAVGFLDFGRVSTLSERAIERCADCLVALAEDDSAGVTDVLLDIAQAPADVDTRQLRAEIGAMMEHYARADISDTMGQTVLSETMGILRMHHLYMPSEYAMLFQTFAVLQGVVLALDPQTKLLDVAEPYIRRTALEKLPQRVGKELIRQLRQYARLIGRLPGTLEATLDRIAAGEIGVKIKFADSEEVLDRAEAIANRFSLTLLLSAVAIALAMVAGQLAEGVAKSAAQILLLGVFLVAAWHFVSIVAAERRSKRRKKPRKRGASGPR